MSSTKSDKSECVIVAVRCRPLNSVEKERGDVDIISINRQQGSITIDKTAANSSSNSKDTDNHDLKTYTFDYTFSSKDEQQTIFEETAKPIVEAVLKGYNGTIFACQSRDSRDTSETETHR